MNEKIELIINKIETLWQKHNAQINELIAKSSLLYADDLKDLESSSYLLSRQIHKDLINKSISFDEEIGEIIENLEGLEEDGYSN